MDVAERFAANLVRCRKRADISQEELAARSSLHRTQIGLLERGQRLPRLDTIVKLAGALAISATELLEGIEWKPVAPTAQGGFAISDEGRPSK